MALTHKLIAVVSRVLGGSSEFKNNWVAYKDGAFNDTAAVGKIDSFVGFYGKAGDAQRACEQTTGRRMTWEQTTLDDGVTEAYNGYANIVT